MHIQNTLTAQKELFIPINADHISMYVCGPTVYDYAHIGNARSVVIYDVLFRLLKIIYNKVTYVRNITDVDDKIINKAYDSNKSISEITEFYTSAFHHDMKYLNCIDPTFEPKATENISVMIDIITLLINNGYAYYTDGHVYFDIESYNKYGQLSNRNRDQQIHGSRIEQSKNKKNFGDFVLWKPASDIDIQLASFWPSPWGDGRPGWHIECSAMSYAYLGQNFDIHGGGADLQFPHHENEIAQSCCAFPGSKFANYWIHNGFLTVDGEKMSKSLGNIVIVKDLIAQNVSGNVIRYALLNTHYRKPLDWTAKTLFDAKEAISKFKNSISDIEHVDFDDVEVHSNILSALKNDLNTPLVITYLHEMIKDINCESSVEKKSYLASMFIKSAELIGINITSEICDDVLEISEEEISALIEKRSLAKANKDFKTADEIRDFLLQKHIVLSDAKDGSTSWHKK